MIGMSHGQVRVKLKRSHATFHKMLDLLAPGVGTRLDKD